MATLDITPPDELERIAAVQRYDVLDTPPDGAFDRVTRIAASLLDMPIAIVSIVDTDRIWFKSAFGLDVPQIDRDPGLCASAILHDTPWVVEDAATDPRTLANPLVAGDFGLRFYAGVPLTTNDGHNLGTVCVLDTEPRELPPGGEQLLTDLAAIVIDELELRLAARLLVRQAEEDALWATELNDDVVQALAVAKLSLEVGDIDRGVASVERGLDAAKRILSTMGDRSPTLRRSNTPVAGD